MSHGKLAKFYKSKRWQRCRLAFMSDRNFICERCGAPATICHHIRYLTEDNVGDPEVSLNPKNLMALCYRCHDEEHNTGQTRRSPTVPGVTFDSEGNLIKTG